MPSNVQLNSGTGGSIAATKQITHDGDTAQVQMMGVFGLSGTEDAYTAGLVNGDATNGLDVDVTRVIPGTTATALGKAEDDAAASGDVGVAALTKRQDTPIADTSLDGDYQPLKSSSTGRLFTSATVDAALPAGTNNIGDVDVLTVPAPLSTTGGGTEATALRVTVASDSTGVLSVDDNGASLTVDNAGLTALNTALRAEDAAHASGDTGMLMLAVRRDAAAVGADLDGDNATLNVNASGRLYTSTTVDAALPAGTNNIGDVDVLTLPNVTLAAGTNTNEVVGDVAHDAVAAGNPVQTGGYATNSIEAITQVAAGDLTRTVHDLNGVQVVRPHTTLEECISERVANTDGASTAFTNFAAGGVGVHNYITQVTIWNSSATDGLVDFRDGTAGAIKWTFPAPQTGGCTVSFDPPLKFADNTAVAFDVSGAISTVYISANGFQAQG